MDEQKPKEVPEENEEPVKELMKCIGFDYPWGLRSCRALALPVTSYSGGWKMNMQLCAAQLMNADVLMLDGPAGHLDVVPIKWLAGWLESSPGSIIRTSHLTSSWTRFARTSSPSRIAAEVLRGREGQVPDDVRQEVPRQEVLFRALERYYKIHLLGAQESRSRSSCA